MAQARAVSLGSGPLKQPRRREPKGQYPKPQSFIRTEGPMDGEHPVVPFEDSPSSDAPSPTLSSSPTSTSPSSVGSLSPDGVTHVRDRHADPNPRLKPEQWHKTISLNFLYVPLGEFTLEANGSTCSPHVLPLLAGHKDWTIRLIKDFSSTRYEQDYECKLKPTGTMNAVAQRLFASTPSLHGCIVIEEKGFLWLNRFPQENVIRVHWMEDATASCRVVPGYNLCFDLDETLIFNTAIPPHAPLNFVVRWPPHLLQSEADADTGNEIPGSDKPLRRPLMDQFLKLVAPHFRNIRVATFSVSARAEEIVEHLDPEKEHLRKNASQDCPVVMAREHLLKECQLRSQNPERGFTWWKSLDMIGLPAKGLYERSIILDDRVDVWAARERDNIVRISAMDRPENIAEPNYLNGSDGGEVGLRIALALINLELRSTQSGAYSPAGHEGTIPAPRPLSSFLQNALPTKSPLLRPKEGNMNNKLRTKTSLDKDRKPSADKALTANSTHSKGKGLVQKQTSLATSPLQTRQTNRMDHRAPTGNPPGKHHEGGEAMTHHHKKNVVMSQHIAQNNHNQQQSHHHQQQQQQQQQHQQQQQRMGMMGHPHMLVPSPQSHTRGMVNTPSVRGGGR